MENKEINAGILVNEYHKCVMSYLISKEYNYEDLRRVLKEFSDQTGMIDYKDDWDNEKMLKEINTYINESIYGKEFKME